MRSRDWAARPCPIYLCSEPCQDSGTIINAALGYYSRTAILTGPGAILSDGQTIPTPEEIMAAWDEITSLDHPKSLGRLGDIFGEFGRLLP